MLPLKVLRDKYKSNIIFGIHIRNNIMSTWYSKDQETLSNPFSSTQKSFNTSEGIESSGLCTLTDPFSISWFICKAYQKRLKKVNNGDWK